MNFGERLRAERERLGLNQKDFGALAGVTKTSQFNYEADERYPDSRYLMAVATAGVDVLFLLTGVRNAALLSPEASQMLNAFDAATPAVRAAALAALLSGTTPASPKMVVHGDVGQTVKGNVTIEGGFSMGGRKK